jgi:ureidoacrylate peracid hydrolase
MLKFKIKPERTALIVFDMVNDFLMPGAPSESVRAREILVPRLKDLIAACRRKKMLIVYACQTVRPDGSDVGILRDIFPGVRSSYAGTPGVEVYHELAPQDGDIVLTKRRFDAFHATELDMILRQRGINMVIVTGTSTSIGTQTTARGAVVRDYYVVFPSDGTINRDLPDAGWGSVPLDELLKVVLTELSQFCRVCSIAELISEIDATKLAE